MPDMRNHQRNSGACDSSREGLTGAKFGMKIWTRISSLRSCLGPLQTKTISTLTKKITFFKCRRRKSNKLFVIRRISTTITHPAFAVGSTQHLMIVYYDRYDRFQQIPFGDFSREGLTGSKDGAKIWTRIGGSCLGLLQTKTISNIKEEK
jgi:hypothetical protein